MLTLVSLNFLKYLYIKTYQSLTCQNIIKPSISIIQEIEDFYLLRKFLST